eukprot:4977856-Amphidinium_carterae.1
MVCRDFEAASLNSLSTLEMMCVLVLVMLQKSIAATFDIFDPSKEILSVSPGWQEFCGQSAAKHRT